MKFNKLEKVKCLLKCAEKYGFDISKSNILTRGGNLKNDFSFYDYDIGSYYVDNSDDAFFHGTYSSVTSYVDGGLIFHICAGSKIKMPFVCHLHDLYRQKFIICIEQFDWIDLDSEETIDYLVKACADKIRNVELCKKEYQINKRKKIMEKDFAV